MMEGRRHSVDIPISRALIALRRVRSLRDPSTNSMSKFSALLDNVNWETNSSNGISLRFETGCNGDGSDQKGRFASKSLGFNGPKEEKDGDLKLHCGLNDSKFMTCQNLGWVDDTGTPTRLSEVDRLDIYRSNGGDTHRHESPNERNHINFRGKELNVSCIMPSSHPMEDVVSCRGPIEGSPLMEDIDESASRWKYRYKNQGKLYGATGGVESGVTTPCPSISDIMSNNSVSLYANAEIDIDQSHRGCGLSHCWSGTPRSREPNLSDVEDHPLLSGKTGQMAHCGRNRHQNIIKEITAFPETPRSLTQKYRPKYFDELVGQNVVVKSLLSAISRGMVSSFYLFHGPRGTGKTSTSRIFAAALNCLSLDDQKPCGRCHECTLFFSGRSRDVKEVDSVRINRGNWVRSLIKNVFVPPFSSRFKVFIIDECQLLHGETWTTVLNALENIAQHVVFVLITPDLDKLPRSAVSRAQKYHFPKIKDADISNRLSRICVEEALNFDQAAVDFVAAKSNGSLRDAEILLDQLSLVGKKITVSLAYELIGIVSDDDLLDLLDLALSSDTSNTVIRARELMRSRIDPLQLTSQLANLIMDIIAGKCEEDSSEARKRFFRKHTSEVDKQKLSYALKILSETEKQLRMSKHQTTWLTVALLQLSSAEYSLIHLNEPNLFLRSAHDKDGDSLCALSPGESFKHLVCSCDDNKASKIGAQGDNNGKLELIWQRVIELCQSNSLKTFLRKHGKLYSLHVNQGVAIAELEFHHHDYVSRAEKSWKLIASSLQSILGCNIEIRLLCAPVSNFSKVKKPSFSFFGCSRRVQQKCRPNTERGSDSDCSDHFSEKPMIKDRHILTSSSQCGSMMSHNCCHTSKIEKALRNGEGNVLSTGTTSFHRSIQDDPSEAPVCGMSPVNRNDCECQVRSTHEPENQPGCFPRTLRRQKKSSASDTTETACTSSKLVLSVPVKTTSSDTYICVDDPCVFYGSSNNYPNSFRDENRQKENSDVLCWRTPTLPTKKAWRMVHQRRRSKVIEYILPCTSAK